MGIKNYRDLVIESDGGKCYICKSDKDLQVHHIKFRSRKGKDDFYNLITLCKKHHTIKYHKVLRAKESEFLLYKATKEKPNEFDDLIAKDYFLNFPVETTLVRIRPDDLEWIKKHKGKLSGMRFVSEIIQFYKANQK